MTKGEDFNTAKIHPMILEEVAPVADDFFDGQTSIELGAKRIQNQANFCQKVG